MLLYYYQEEDGYAMTDAEDPAILAELQFEQIRRFTDSWVTNVTETHFSRYGLKHTILLV